MVNINVKYLGGLKCAVTHEPSGETFYTDAPLDHKGEAKYISPTDLVAAALASCAATIMGMRADESGIDITGMEVNVTKDMVNQPRRMIKKLIVNIIFPYKLDEKSFEIMTKIVKFCPVYFSINPEIEVITNYSCKEQ
jgi:uncharacterized OsmC-like protein